MSMNTVSVSLPASTLPSTLAILINTPLSPAKNDKHYHRNFKFRASYRFCFQILPNFPYVLSSIFISVTIICNVLPTGTKYIHSN